MRALAADLVDQLGVTEPPVPLEMVASMVDIVSITQVADMVEAGCLIVGSAGGEVRLRASDSRVRKRFTLGHECGHTFHAGYELAARYRCSPTYRTTARSGQRVEQLSDIAASELVLPRSLLRRDVAGEPVTRHLLADLADLYQASLTSTAIAAIDVCPCPAAIVVLEVQTKPSEAGTDATAVLRTRWHHSRGGWPYLPRFKSAQANDVFSRALEGEVVHERNAHIDSITRHPVTADVQAWRADYHTPDRRVPRVLALLTRPDERRPGRS